MSTNSNLFFKNLVTKWIESLNTFRWQNFKLLFLGSLATFKRSLFLLIKYFWWLISLPILSLALVFVTPFLVVLVPIVSLGTLVSLFFFAMLAVRPSVENKNFTYFMTYFKKFFLGFLVIFSLLILGPKYGLLPFLSVTLLFFLDSKGDLESFFYSFINSGKMFFYFLPGFLILSIFCGPVLFFNLLFAGFLVTTCASSLYFVVALLLTFLFMLLYLSFLTVYYIKIKHQDFQLFLQ